jgi:hypothetical protein
MAKGSEVLSMLLPGGGWVISGDEYENIQFIEAETITKEEFEAGFAKVDQLKSEQEAKAIEAKQIAISKLAALGLDLDDLKSLGF